MLPNFRRPSPSRPAATFTRRTLISTAALLVALSAAGCKVAAAQSLTRADVQMRKQVVETTIREMNDHYVFPEKAKELEKQLRQKLASKAYEGDALADPRAFVDKLTQDIQSVTLDKHIRVRHSETVLPPMRPRDPTPAEIEDMKRQGASRNWGIERVERLRFNIGYLDLRGFQPAQFAGHKIAAAMTLLSDTHALIVDLRQNGGGDPATVQLISSYLFDDRTHLNNMYYREGDITTQAWTFGWVPGERFGGKKPVYVLTAKRTFSAAEEFSYNLKNLKRATLVGETTGGGAHPGGMRRLNDHFAVFVPKGRAINPISKTNWEGVGVEPDIKVSADDALRVARIDALKKLDASKESEDYKKQLAEHIAEIEKDGKAAPSRP